MMDRDRNWVHDNGIGVDGVSYVGGSVRLYRDWEGPGGYGPCL